MKRAALILIIFLALLPFVNYYMITAGSEKLIFSNIAALPEYRNVLVFGAGMNYPSHRPNLSFNSRLDAAEKAAQLPFVKRIILSGRAMPSENESLEMHKKLIDRGIDPMLLIIDSAGTNTLQSLKNYKHLYKDEAVILISEKKHLERALYYAKNEKIKSCGYATLFSKNNFIRELLSRLKATLEILFNS